MLKKIVLCVNRYRATAGLWRMGKLATYMDFANDDDGHEAGRKWLQSHRSVPIHIIADTQDEDLRLETLPHVRGSQRQHMLERKLNQYYRGLNFRAAQWMSRESDGRRDDRFLLSALTKPEVIAPWLQIAEAASAPLAGIYLMSALSRLLVEKLGIANTNLLLTARHSAGLRQSHFKGQVLHLSRLIPHAQTHGHYVNETEKTLLYLLNAQLSAATVPLHMVFVGLEEADAALVAALEHHAEVAIRIITQDELASKIGLNTEQLRRHPDLVLMHLLACLGSTANLAPKELLKPLRMGYIGTSLNIASGAILASAAMGSAINTATALSWQRETSGLAGETGRLEQRYNEVAHTFPASPLTGSNLKTAVELAARLDHLNRTPQRMMYVLGNALDHHPEIRLKRLQWRMAGPTAGEEYPSLANLHEAASIEGEIVRFDGDYGTALQQVAQFAASLKNSPLVEHVDILEQPINTSSLQPLQGSTLEQKTQHASVSFKLRISLKEPTS